MRVTRVALGTIEPSANITPRPASRNFVRIFFRAFQVYILKYILKYIATQIQTDKFYSQSDFVSHKFYLNFIFGITFLQFVK